MATAMAANTANSIHTVRSTRAPNMGSSAMNGESSRSSRAMEIGSAFGTARASWNSNIWGDNNLTASFNEDHSHDTAFEAKSGSGSLLNSSESDTWNSRPNLPWSTVNSTSTSLPMAQKKFRTTTPGQTRPSDRSAPALSETPDTTSYFSLPRSSRIGSSSGGMSHQSYLNGAAGGIPSSTESVSLGSLGRFPGGDGRQQLSSSTFRDPSVGSAFHRSGFAGSLDPSSNDDVAASVSMASLQQGFSDALAKRRPSYAHLSQSSASIGSRRASHSAHPSYHSESQGGDSRHGNKYMDVSSGLGQLHFNDGSFGAQRPSYLPQLSYEGTVNRSKAIDDGTYQSLNVFSANSGVEPQLASVNRSRFVDHGQITPTEFSTIGPPLYSNIESAPSSGQFRPSSANRLLDSQVAMLDRKLRGIYQDDYSQIQSLHFPPTYDYPSYQAARVNAFAGIYPVTPLGGLGAASLVTRAHREHDSSQVTRSPLLEEFRANSKGNKRYELRDIYNHVVEFSGDQHGSRFIQQKLETANSDEKEQVFREIQPNSLQLMTDVFGNYVVQKLFEHGNQTQKKILANQMKGHVLALSTQMYGCRVVQKALEHILTDQQAMLVKELENHVLKCVRDQNGNHVIQKAIERVPSHYVQFIINAFRGQVSRLAAHPYGCRVIQRMLEHCEEADRESILAELHACTASLIPDQFGNYVIQHVIENGEEKDRSRMIAVVISQLLGYSKHKFASNVVEKSIEFGEESQRRHIIHSLISPNERGESHLLTLMRDQYGNYVIQKVLGQLKDDERDVLVDQIKPLLNQLKKFSYGKQIVAIEKLIFDAKTPSSVPFASTASSTTPPNSHKSSPLPLRRSLTGLEACRAPIGGAAPPTPPPNDQGSVEGNLDTKTFLRSTVLPTGHVDANASVSLAFTGLN